MTVVWMVLLPIVGMLLGLIAARLLFKQVVAPGSFDAENKLNELERRVSETLDRNRDSFASSQLDLTNQLSKRLDDSRTSLDNVLSERFDRFQSSQVNSLNDLRTDLDKRLGALDSRMTQFQESFLKSLGEATNTLTKSQFEHSEKQIKSLNDFQNTVSKRLQEVLDTNAASGKQLQHALDSRFADLSRSLGESQTAARREATNLLEAIRKAQDSSRDTLSQSLNDFQSSVAKQLQDSREEQSKRFGELTNSIRSDLDAMRKDNEGKLENIRQTVDDRLHTTLENRLGESFKLVSGQLEQVHKGLGEMQVLATGVGDLKRVLTNVRSRGTFGETQLAALLEQILAPSQYEKNFATKPGSSERVEFAVKFPGKDEAEGAAYLPIDAKFPREDYERLMTALDVGDVAGQDNARKGLRQRLLSEAATIREKYVAPPHTLDIAFMFLPVEGLYAEALRLNGLAEEMQAVHKVVLVGPTTLYAVLNSLRMGFQTLAIEKRSSEVWQVLGAVKTEFGKFGESLNAVSKRLEQAHGSIDDTLKRSRAIERRLRGVESLPEQDAVKLLPETAITTEELDETE